MAVLTKAEKLRKEENAKSFKPLINDLINCDGTDFIKKLKDIKEWDRSRDDLYIWIPVLDRIDEILSNVLKKYSYDTTDWKKNGCKLELMNTTDEDEVWEYLAFTTRLLNNTMNRGIYNSLEVMNSLLNCPNFRIKLGAARVIATIGERNVVSRNIFDNKSIMGTDEMKDKSLELALCLPSSTTDDKMEHFALVDLFFDKKQYPSKLGSIEYKYFTKSNKRTNKDTVKSPCKQNYTHSHKMHNFKLSKDELKSLTLQQIFDRGMLELPREEWFKFSLRATVAKAFSDDSFENMQLRNQIIQTKFNAIAIINVIFHPAQVSSRFFEIDPYAFNSLSEFLSLSETKVPRDIRMDALFALECISLKHIWCSDIVRNLGGNMSHGLLFQILKYISKLITENNLTEIDEEYNVRLFYLISNLADVRVLQESLLNAGLVPSILDIISVSTNDFKRTKTSATHLLEVLMSNDSIDPFINNNGLNILIETLKKEVQFALEHPEYGTPPKYSVIFYSISFRQIAFIRSLLKLVLKLLSCDSGNRTRNLIDSPILGALNSILRNKPVFGYTLLSHVLDIIQTVINVEPTIYQVLVESEIIPFIMENFEQFVCPSTELLKILPEVISALCLHADGLKQVRERNLIKYVFQIPPKLEYAKIMNGEEEAINLGSSLDELARHYPDLKEDIADNFVQLVDIIPSVVHFDHPYLYKSTVGDNNFYLSADEEVIDNEQNSKEIASWEVQEYSAILETFSGVFFGMMENVSWVPLLSKKIDPKKLFSVIIPERPAYDYIDSQCFLNFTDALKTFDDEDSKYALPTLLALLKYTLDDLSDFINYDQDKSYVLSLDPDTVENTLRKVNILQVIVSTITSVYIDRFSLFPERVHQILEYFDENGFSLIHLLRTTFERCALEEYYIRGCLPIIVSEQTRPATSPETPSLLLYKGAKAENDVKTDNTAAKFKNTLQNRFLFHTTQSCISIIFRAILRLSHQRKMTLASADLSIELRIFNEVAKSFVDMLSNENLQNKLGHLVVLLNLTSFSFTYVVANSRTLDTFNTIPILLFYQLGGFQVYKNWCLLLAKKCLDIPDVSSVESIAFLKDDQDVLISHGIVATLSFMNKALQLQTMEMIRSTKDYYPNDDISYNITSGVIVTIKILVLGMVKEIFEIDELFSSDRRRFPYPVFKQLLNMIKNIYSSADEVEDSDFSLYELRWDLVPPSQCKINMLKSCGMSEEVARGYLEEQSDDLPMLVKPDVFSENEWEKYKAARASGEWKTDLQLLPPPYENYSTKGDLCEFRASFYRNGFEQKVLSIVQNYPKLINAVSKMFLEIYDELEFPHVSMLEDLLSIMNSTKIEKASQLAPIVHLFGIFLNEEKIYNQSKTVIHKFITFLLENLAPQYVNHPWFFKALYAYEIILSRSMFPDYEEVPTDFKMPEIPTVDVQHLSSKDKETIFNVLIRVPEISDFYSSLAISRILILYAANEKYAREIVQSGIIPKLLKVIGAHQKSDKINYLESSLLLLCRRCFETKEVVTSLIKYELNRAFTTRAIGDMKEKSRDLTLLIAEKANIIMRDPEIFVTELCKTGRMVDFSSSHELSSFLMKRVPEENNERIDIVPSADVIFNKRTSIVDLLLSQLMAAYKKDWLTEPATPKEDEKKSKKKQRLEVKASKNPICAYMIFLLKVLMELLSSYNHSKYEFMTFNKRGIYSESPAPRTTALNFFIHQLLDYKTQDGDVYAAKRRETIGKLATCVLTCFVSSVQDERVDKPDPKAPNPDMTFIRKFTLESISKAMKDLNSTKFLESNVGKYHGWFNLIHRLLVTDNWVNHLLDGKKLNADRYEICKLMLELRIPETITECLSTLDLNVPFSKKVFNAAVDPLNSITEIRNDYSDFFKLENNEEEDDVDEESDKDDVPDMFRNSALGMYDIEDIEDDDDDDSLIGDEDVAFVQDNDDIEIVFSDEEDEQDSISESDSSESDDSSSDGAEESSGDEDMDVHMAYNSSDESMSVNDNEEDASEHDSYYSESSPMLVEIDEPAYGSDLEIDLDDSELSSDWESGLSELDDTDYNSDDSQQEEDSYNPSRARNVGNNTWVTSDGVELYDDSDGEGRGIYRGVQHVTNDELIFRIDHRSMSSNRRGRHHNRTAIAPSIISLGGESDRSRNMLTNPLGPHGMEEVEDIITNNQLEDTPARRFGSGITGFWLAESLMDNKSVEGIIVKKTTERWGDIFEMFYENKGFLGNILPEIVSRVIKRSSELWCQRQLEYKAQKMEENSVADRTRKRNLDEMAMAEDEAENASSREVSDVVHESDNESEVATDNHEPVYVIIDGNEVDIGGTDIDPEFINALPEDMRAEVLAQHISERRAEAQQQNINSREINDEFLDSVPANIREEIIAGENVTRRFSHLLSNRRVDEFDGDLSRDDHDLDSDQSVQGNTQPKSKRVHFDPLVDRSGIATIIKSLFIPQPYLSRESYHELFFKLCSSKQNRSDIMNFLLLILTEGIADQFSLEKVFNLISNKANSSSDHKNIVYQLPPDCTPLIVANQCIEVLQFMIDSDARLRYFFVTEHDNLIINKPYVKTKKDIFSKNMKWPINALFSLFNQKLVTDETVLMDLLTDILESCSKPITSLVKKKNASNSKRNFEIPVIEKKHLELIVSVIKLDSCNTKIFKQTLNLMTNLFSIKDTQEIFTSELRTLAMSTISQLIADLNELCLQLPNVKSGTEINSEIIQKFTAPSSEQSKLLKVVTAVDYIYSHQKEGDTESSRKLVALFNEMKLGAVWVALSKCLSAFEEKSPVSTSATILLPTIESLMVVCKNSKVREVAAGQLKYTEKSYDFETIPVEDLFFEFTDLHKKLLNEMIRATPQLMSGPFQLLVKNPKILDFDNKRHFFMAKLRQNTTTRQKLSITVLRDQVFLDSYRALFFKSNDEIKNCKLDITFKGEAGVDEGGVTREWYQVLSRQMFNPDYALFIPVGTDNTKFRPNRTSGINPEHLSFFKFVGMIIGKAISDNCFLDCHFSREVYKNILGKPVSLKDMESLDLEYYKSLNWMLENDITYVIDETFSVDTDDYGEHKTIDLIPNGRNIPVTEENKKEYVQKIVEYKLQESVKDHMQNLLQGFYAVIDKDLISIFDEQELELLISGLPDIDVDDWKNNTTYVNYTPTCKQINYFWRAVRSFDKEERAKLLQFVTGTSKLPLNGFKDLSGINGDSKFSIHRDYGSTERLPSSHTCFNQLDLPAYDSYEQLRGSLLLAINEGHEGFGLA